MGKAKSDVLIENENLFRALVCAPIAILFGVMAVNSVISPGIVLFKVIFVLMALYFSLSALAYAAYYTNERFEGKAEPVFENKNLSKALLCAPFAVLFVTFALNSITSSSSIFFSVLYVLIALYFTLSTLAYAAFYTNDYYAQAEAHH